MPDFTVIDGGNDPGRFDREVSKQNLEAFILALLRDPAAGTIRTERSSSSFVS
jgi:hypothetical protein